MMSTVLRAQDPHLSATTSRTLFAFALSALLLAAGCKKTPAPVAEAQPAASASPAQAEQPRNPAKPSAIVEIPSPSPAAQPASPRIMYVNTAFEAQSNVGTHQFPVNARVSVVGEEGDEYVVEYQGVRVNNKKSFFSGAMVEEIAPLKSNTAARSLDSNFVAEPTPPPIADPAMAVDEKKSTELINEIRTVNEDIRVAEEKLSKESNPSADQKSAEAATVEKLKKRRDKLSEELTTVAKP